MLNQKVDYVNETALAADIGLESALPLKNLKIGMLLSNLGGSMEGGSLPMTFKLGTAYKLSWKGYGDLLSALDVVLPLISSDQTPQVNMGGEYLFKIPPQQLAFRAGYRTGTDMGSFSGVSMGLGYLIKLGRIDLGLDYAYIFQGDLGVVLGGTHHFTLATSF